MKSALPYYGVRSAPCAGWPRRASTPGRPADRPTWEATVRALFDDADPPRGALRRPRPRAAPLGAPVAGPAALAALPPPRRGRCLVGRRRRGRDRPRRTDPAGRTHRGRPRRCVAWAVGRRPVATSHRGHRQVGAKDCGRPRPARGLPRPEPRTPRVLAAQGLRLGAARRGLPATPSGSARFVAAHPEMSGLTRREGTKHLVGVTDRPAD